MIRDLLRLLLEARLSERQAARSLSLSRSTVQNYGARFRVGSARSVVDPDDGEWRVIGGISARVRRVAFTLAIALKHAD